MAILSTVLTVIFVITSILLILIILLQSNRSAGMGLFGGASQTAFGSGSADVLTKTTGILAALFMILALALAFIKSRESSRLDELKQEFQKDSSVTAPVAEPAATEAQPANAPVAK